MNGIAHIIDKTMASSDIFLYDLFFNRIIKIIEITANIQVRRKEYSVVMNPFLLIWTKSAQASNIKIKSPA